MADLRKHKGCVPRGPHSLNFNEVLGKIWQNHMLVLRQPPTREGLVPLPWGNPGSATV